MVIDRALERKIGICENYAGPSIIPLVLAISLCRNFRPPRKFMENLPFSPPLLRRDQSKSMPHIFWVRHRLRHTVIACFVISILLEELEIGIISLIVFCDY